MKAEAEPQVEKEEKKEEEEPEPEEEKEEEEEEEEEDDDDLSLVAWIILGICLGAGIGLLVWRLLGLRKRDKQETITIETLAEEPAPPPGAEPLEVVETDVQRLLRLAREAIERGDHREAVDDAYAALMRRLAGDGLVELDITRTNGDHVRSLDRNPPLQQGVFEVILDVERVQFGHAEPANVSRSLLERVTGIVAKRLAPIAMLVAMISSASCINPGGGETTTELRSGGLLGRGVNATGPMGSKAVMELLERNDVDVVHHTGAYEELFATHEPIVLMGGAVPSPAEWKLLLDWVDDGGTLVVATWPAAVHPDTGAWSVLRNCEPSTLVTSGTSDTIVARVPALGVVEPTGAMQRIVLLQRGQNLYAARFYKGSGETIVFADDFLFTNASMAADENPVYVVRFFETLTADGTVRIVDTWTDVGADTPLEVLANTQLTPIVVQLLILLALIYLWRGVAFGRLRDPKPPSRRAFADHVRALGNQYEKLRASDYILAAYGSWCVERLRSRVPGGLRMDLGELARELAARTHGDAESILRVLTTAGNPQAVAGLNKRGQLHLRRELARLLHLVGGSR